GEAHGARSCSAAMVVERNAERARGAAVSIAHQSFADDLDRHAVLQGYGAHHGRIGGHDASAGACAMIGDENFAQLTVYDRAGDGEAEPLRFDFEICGRPALREAGAFVHGTLRKNGGMSNGCGADSHEILSITVRPVWLRSQTNHAKAMPLLALRPSHPA